MTNKKAGRPPTYTDDTLLAHVADGADTPDKLLAALGLRLKTTLLIRLRRMQDRGLVTVHTGPRYLGYRITVNDKEK